MGANSGRGLVSGLLSTLVAAMVWTAIPAQASELFAKEITPLSTFVSFDHVEGGARISQVRYNSGGSMVRAWLVEPVTGPTSRPGVLFVHWLGDPATTNHTEFLADAEWLASRGCTSLLPDEPWAASHWFGTVRSTDSDKADSIAEVVGLRRALDVLASVSGVDPHRLAYVGHDFGAMYGALLAGADPRPAYYVFMTPTVTFAEWFLLDTHRPPVDPAAYTASLAELDIPAALRSATFTGSLAQFAAHDEYVSQAKADAFAAALPDRDRTVTTYDTDHGLQLDAATRERRMWLATHLGTGAI